MSAQLVIRDGSPNWYFSPDIWVVPGNDPNGAAGSPVAGHPAYLWAHVANTGNADAFGVRVDFYWANPALQVLRSTATLVGSAFADVPAGSAQDALCLVAWVPVIVNGGHECLVAVANHAADPLPQPLPDAFDPPTYRQVAQKNLSVLTASPRVSSHALTIAASQRADKAVRVQVEVGGALDDAVMARLGLKGLKPARGDELEVGLDLRPGCPAAKDPLGQNKLDLRVPRGTCAAVYASIRATKLKKGEYQLVHVTERSGDRILGGLGFVVIPEAKEAKS